MHLSKFASLSVAEIHDSTEVQNWLQHEARAFLVPYLESIDCWANGEDIVLQNCGTGKHFVEPLEPYVQKKGHTVYGLDKSPSMIAHAQKDCELPNFKWVNQELSNWRDSNDSILPPRKLLTLHSLHTVTDLGAEFKTWFDTLFYDGKVWGMVLAESDIYRLLSHLKAHQAFEGTIGKDLDIPPWADSRTDPREMYVKALEEAGFQDVNVEVQSGNYKFPTFEALLYTVVALYPTIFEKHMKDSVDWEAFAEACFKFWKVTVGSPPSFHYKTLVFSAVKPKPWEEVAIGTERSSGGGISTSK